MRIATIVEGHGEVQALPQLIRRIGRKQDPPIYIELPEPIRTKRDRFLKYEIDFEKHLRLAAKKSGANGKIFVLLDAEEDCPATLGPATVNKIKSVIPHKQIAVAFAKVEFETWFLAGAESISGLRDLPNNLTAPENPESIGSAKGWISRRMPANRNYKETIDQAAFASSFDIDLAEQRSPSLNKFIRELISLFQLK
jgi:hypothetical protein